MREVVTSKHKNINCSISIAVDGYQNHCIHGRIYHENMAEEVSFCGWAELMRAVNQICDDLKYPKMTVNMRAFFRKRKLELRWREKGEEQVSFQPKGRYMTFQLSMAFRYYASWQGNITWLEGDKEYEFESFMRLLHMMGSILEGKEPKTADFKKEWGNCHIAVDSYDGRDIAGDFLQIVLNVKERFDSIGDLVSYMYGQAAESANGAPSGVMNVITSESLGYYRKGGKSATFAVRVLYRQHSTIQGIIFCRELKQRRPFRSFMEMIYIMTSVLDEEAAWSETNNIPDHLDQQRINCVG